ncbi:TIR domain-containing protein [Colwellia chukchiensis]|uniref:TIR domain-containing protein n=1 Tax=Colwellia chukchiensis TaxID=641665 RepID=A0A1H7U9G8_9GAMM|nr:TIR domain-containing protein [Colwellia chukchiensis]SEL93338.1 TIR domain-containing protein [Colwellia chukchiensis]
MSLKKKKKEITRLISAFEQEANKFHDLSFSMYYFEQKLPEKKDTFKSPNHSIMLWQYYGSFDNPDSSLEFIENIKNSDLQWGMRGSSLSAFAVLEGEKCPLFVRMATRAGGLFNEKESYFLKSRVVGEIADSLATTGKPVSVTNDHQLAVWLNYLLYFVSQIKPEKEKLQRIEPEPFALSLQALEALLEEPQIKKSKHSIENICFKVALSFPGEQRQVISNVFELLEKKLGKGTVFYDFKYSSQLARPDLANLLKSVYEFNSELIVVFLCKEYTEKMWCGIEWEFVQELISGKEASKVMYIKLDDFELSHIRPTDGYIDARDLSDNELCDLIIERVALL